MNAEVGWGGSRGSTSGGRRGGRRGGTSAGNGPKPGDVVLDSGAVLAVLEEAPGRLVVEARLAAPGTAVIETTSLLEVMCRLSDRGLSPSEVEEVVDALALRIEPVNEELTRRAVEVGAEIEVRDLSLAQLCCVALGRKMGLPVLSTDAGLENLQGVEVIGG